MKSNFRALCAVVTTTLLLSLGLARAQTTTVWTQHMDNWRSGWNYSESLLNQQTVASAAFGVTATVTLDGTVDGQPLVMPKQQISCTPGQTIVSCQAGLSGYFEVVYVVTENDTLYAINAANGAILLKRSFLPVGGTGVIQSTPVIDTYRNTIDFVTLGIVNAVSTLTVHALNLADFSDYATPFVLTSLNTTATLSNGATYGFNPDLARSHSALLWANGAIYVAFQASDETNPAYYGKSRGWLVKFSAENLLPIKAVLTDSRATSQEQYFISSVWMSRAGPAADSSATNANIYFITGNSDPSGTSYDPVYNQEESLVALTENLDPFSIFTPYQFAAWDKVDLDFGSGSAMKIPNNFLYPNNPVSLVVGAGKSGTMYLLNAASLGGLTPGGPDKVLATANIGPCWCSPSFYVGRDGIGRIVSSGGTSLIVWKILYSGNSEQLVQEASAPIMTGNAANYQQGFFTTVSSNGTTPSVTSVIWALTRPVAGSNEIHLYAFSGNVTSASGTLTQLGEFPAGVWNQHYNSNLVPVVANGRVYVASDGILTIFGLK